jgi:hypothetical protein
LPHPLAFPPCYAVLHKILKMEEGKGPTLRGNVLDLNSSCSPSASTSLVNGAPCRLHLRRRCNNADRASALALAWPAAPSDAWTGCCLVGCCDSCLLLFGTRLCAGLSVKQNWEGTGAAIFDAPAGTTCTRRRDAGPLVKTLFTAVLSLSLFPGAHGMPHHALDRSHVFHRGMNFMHSFEFGQTLDLAKHILQLQMPGSSIVCAPLRQESPEKVVLL